MPKPENFVMVIKKILIVNIPENIVDQFISDLQTYILNQIVKIQAKGLILNLSMIEVLDSYFARTLIETIQMGMIMGSMCVVVGMKASIAITSVEMGLDLTGIISAIDIDEAIEIIEATQNW